MHQFEIGDRVVYKGHTGIPIEAGEKGIVEWVTLPDDRSIYVRTEQGRVCRLKASNLELDDSAVPS